MFEPAPDFDPGALKHAFHPHARYSLCWQLAVNTAEHALHRPVAAP